MVTVRSLNKRSTTILIAGVLALGTGLLAFNYLSSVNKVAHNVPMRSVVIAAREIPVRTVITPEMLSITDRTADSVDPDAVANVGAVTGQVALISIPSGGTISVSKVGHIGLGGLTVQIPKGQRAISIALDRVKGVADLIQSGDHVDVIAVTQPHGTGGVPKALTILRNKVVLAMGSVLETPIAAATSPSPDASVETATLSLTPKEAQTLVLADLNATLRLTLRSGKDLRSTEAGDPFILTEPDVQHAAPAPAPGAPTLPQPALTKPVAPTRHTGPSIIDGDRFVNS